MPTQTTMTTNEYLFATIRQLCGHDQRVLKMYALFGTRGLCEVCCKFITEIREELAQARYGSGKPVMKRVIRTTS